MPRLFIILLSVITIYTSCSKERNTTASERRQQAAPGFLTYKLQSNSVLYSSISGGIIKITFDDTVTNADSLAAFFTVSPGCTVTYNNKTQVSNVSKNNYNAPFNYQVTNAAGISAAWQVQPYNNNYTYAWGMGGFISASNNFQKSYDWYIDQMNTGFDAGDNCGPSCVTMACKWADSTFSKTAEDARNAYVPAGGWWYTSDIDSYLTDNKVTHSIIALANNADSTATIIKKQLNQGQLILLCIDMNFIRLAADERYHTDKFYATTPQSGHFFIIKGYTVVDGELFFRVYDPNNWGSTNSDGSPKGKDRFYRYEDVFAAAQPWWQYAFNIAKKGAALTGRYAPVSIKNIPVQYGR